MEYSILGRTGLRVSVAGLGAGGHSRLGQARGHSRAESIAVIHAALDLGINFVDTALTYGTQPIVGEALKGRREDVVISTKTHITDKPFQPDARFLTADELRARLERSLTELQTDYIDVYHMHGVELHEYDHCREHVFPVLMRLREEGKIRFLGITERFIVDTGHQMLSRAVNDGLWDVAMVGFNMLNPSARDRVLPATAFNGVGTLNMFAVRRALNNADNVAEAVATAVDAGQIDPAVLDGTPPLAFLTEEAGAGSLAEAAYRFCRHEPGIDVVLTGTGSIDHLRQNVAAITMPPLPDPARDRLRALFGAVDSISGN